MTGYFAILILQIDTSGCLRPADVRTAGYPRARRSFVRSCALRAFCRTEIPAESALCVVRRSCRDHRTTKARSIRIIPREGLSVFLRENSGRTVGILMTGNSGRTVKIRIAEISGAAGNFRSADYIAAVDADQRAKRKMKHFIVLKKAEKI